MNCLFPDYRFQIDIKTLRKIVIETALEAINKKCNKK